MCFDAVVLSVDCEKDNSLNVTTNILSQIVTNINNSLTNKIINVFVASQANQIKIGKMSGSTLNVTNFVNAQLKYMTTVDNSVTAQISQTLIDTISQKIDQMNSTEQELLSKALNGQNKTDIMTTITKVVNNNINTSVLNEIINHTAFVQNNILEIGELTASQVNVTNDMFVSAVMETVAKNILSSNEITDMQNTIDNNVKVENKDESKGLNSIVDSITNMLKDIGMAWIIGIAVICVAAILFLPMILKALSGSNVQVSRKGVSIKKAPESTSSGTSSSTPTSSSTSSSSSAVAKAPASFGRRRK